jgi:hypothetical protein
MTFDYKKYSLEQLENWVHDAMSSDASPHEIYSAIREAVREDYYYHKDRLSRASGLLELLSGHRPVADKELFEAALAEREYYEGVSKPLSCDKNDPSPECQGAWNDFWEEHYYPEEGLQYTNEELDAMCDAATSAKKGKVNKWILPVDEVQNAETGEDECFVTFPDDLLEAADLKEGDQVEWVDQGDGSYLLRKVPLND